MGDDRIPGPFDLYRLWLHLPELKGKERAEAIAKLEGCLRKHKKKEA